MLRLSKPPYYQETTMLSEQDKAIARTVLRAMETSPTIGSRFAKLEASLKALGLKVSILERQLEESRRHGAQLEQAVLKIANGGR